VRHAADAPWCRDIHTHSKVFLTSYLNTTSTGKKKAFALLSFLACFMGIAGLLKSLQSDSFFGGGPFRVCFFAPKFRSFKLFVLVLGPG
jgi:hypothetical protein